VTIPQKSAAPTPNQMRPSTLEKHSVDVAKLARFIENHHHLKGDSKVMDGHHFVEVKGTDKEVAIHLGVATDVLDHCYAELAKRTLIKRHGAHKIEILDAKRLAEVARHAG